MLLSRFVLKVLINLLIATFAMASEKYVSLKDLAEYANHPTAKLIAKDLEMFARGKQTQLSDQTLISVRPQQDLVAGRKISFVMFFLANKKADRKQSLLLKVSAELNASKDKILDPVIENVTELSKTQFSVQVSLIELKAKVYDSVTGSTFIYPIGGSAFDVGILPRSMGKTIFASPAFVGSMPKSAAIESRKSPAYYAGKPFLRIVPNNSSESLYGFHTTPFDYLDKHKSAENLARGYVSAGCLRLKDDDLSELYQIVAYGAATAVPVEIKYTTDWQEQHPYPIINNGYHTVSGYCWKMGEGSSPCLSEYQKGARPVFSTVWVEKDPQQIIKKLYDYGKAKVTAIGFEIN